MPLNSTIGYPGRAVTEVSTPTLQQVVQPLSNIRPCALLTRVQNSFHLHVTQNTFLACCPYYPGGSKRMDRLHPRSASAFPDYWAGRHPRLSFRGLLKVHSRCGPSGCKSPIGIHLSPELQQEGLPISLSGCYRDEPIISRAELSSTGILRPRGAPTCCGRARLAPYFRLLRICSTFVVPCLIKSNFYL